MNLERYGRGNKCARCVLKKTGLPANWIHFISKVQFTNSGYTRLGCKKFCVDFRLKTRSFRFVRVSDIIISLCQRDNCKRRVDDTIPIPCHLEHVIAKRRANRIKRHWNLDRRKTHTYRAFDLCRKINLKIRTLRRIIIGTKPGVDIYGALNCIYFNGVEYTRGRTIIIQIDSCLATRVVIHDSIPRRIVDDEMPIIAGKDILGENCYRLIASNREKMLDHTRESLVKE